MIKIAILGTKRLSSFQKIGPQLKGTILELVRNKDRNILDANKELLFSQFDGDFDAIVIEPDVSDQLLIANAAISAGKHVLLQVPSHHSPTNISKLISLARANKTKLCFGNHLRFSHEGQTIKKEIDSGNLGQPGLLRIHRWEPSKTSQNEVSKTDLPNQVTNSTIIPEIDFANWLFGEIPRNLYATSQGLLTQNPLSSDYTQIHLGFSNGGMALIDYSKNLPKGSGYNFTSVVGSKGAIYFDDHQNINLVFKGGHPEGLNLDYGNDPLRDQIQNFIDTLRDDQESETQFEEVFLNFKVIKAVEHSLTSGKSSKLENDEYKQL